MQENWLLIPKQKTADKHTLLDWILTGKMKWQHSLIIRMEKCWGSILLQTHFKSLLHCPCTEFPFLLNFWFWNVLKQAVPPAVRLPLYSRSFLFLTKGLPHLFSMNGMGVHSTETHACTVRSVVPPKKTSKETSLPMRKNIFPANSSSAELTQGWAYQWLNWHLALLISQIVAIACLLNNMYLIPRVGSQ